MMLFAVLRVPVSMMVIFEKNVFVATVCCKSYSCCAEAGKSALESIESAEWAGVPPRLPVIVTFSYVLPALHFEKFSRSCPWVLGRHARRLDVFTDIEACCVWSWGGHCTRSHEISDTLCSLSCKEMLTVICNSQEQLLMERTERD